MTDLTDSDTQALIDYARQKYAEERRPLSPELREVRAVLTKLREQPPAPPAAPARPHGLGTVVAEELTVADRAPLIKIAKYLKHT
jgi:hypothetical protein